ncbi:MAG TPA: ribonuclease III [Bauldia sp.]|nr:ribonuclease III [Bauldia sp.]
MKAAGDAGLAGLEDRLGHSFRDRALLVTALTHASAVTGTRETYQRLEFLGDRVLGLIVTEMLVAAFPKATEGELSLRLADLVRKEACAEVAIALDMGSAIRFGGGKAQRIALATTNVLADVCEAVIGAIYLDGGIEAARTFVEARWRGRLTSATVPMRNAKAALQEWAQAKGHGVPTYAIAAKSGPDHEPRFEVEARVGNLAPSRGEGRTRRDAEQAAAAVLLAREGVWPVHP